MFDRLFLFLDYVVDLHFNLTDFRRNFHARQPLTRSGLIDNVDCLVGQKTVGNIPLREFHRFLDGLLGIGHLMMVLVSVSQSHKNLHRFLGSGRIDHNGLEPPGQSPVFFNIFAVFIQRRCAHALNFPAGKRWFEYIGSVQAAFGAAGAHYCVQFVDKNDDIVVFL